MAGLPYGEKLTSLPLPKFHSMEVTSLVRGHFSVPLLPVNNTRARASTLRPPHTTHTHHTTGDSTSSINSCNPQRPAYQTFVCTSIHRCDYRALPHRSRTSSVSPSLQRLD